MRFVSVVAFEEGDDTVFIGWDKRGRAWYALRRGLTEPARRDAPLGATLWPWERLPGLDHPEADE